MSDNYEERKQARIDRYKDRAQNAEKRGDQLYESGMSALRQIPFGQPIMIGHHSEKRDRNFRALAGAKIDKAMGEREKASYYEEKAQAAENNIAISSDDPEAIVKLQEKIEAAEEIQVIMKAANKIIQKKKLSDEEKIIELVKIDKISKETAKLLLAGDCMGYIGFPSYKLINNNANIRRMKERIAHLKRVSTQETTELKIGDVTICDNVEENRVQIFFPGKPNEEIRSFLKSNGFRWCRYNSAWQRHRSTRAQYLAKEAAKMACNR